MAAMHGGMEPCTGPASAITRRASGVSGDSFQAELGELGRLFKFFFFGKRSVSVSAWLVMPLFPEDLVGSWP